MREELIRKINEVLADADADGYDILANLEVAQHEYTRPIENLSDTELIDLWADMNSFQG